MKKDLDGDYKDSCMHNQGCENERVPTIFQRHSLLCTEDKVIVDQLLTFFLIKLLFLVLSNFEWEAGLEDAAF